MAISALIVALVVAFVFANVWVEVVNESAGLHWSREALSDYLVGVRGSVLTSSIYVGLVAAEVMVIFNQPRSLPATICLVVAAAGLMGVVVTANVMVSGGWVWKFHYVLAGFAFVASLAAEFVILWPRPEVGFAAGGLATVIAFFLFARRRPALAEKVLTAWLLGGLLAIVIPAL